LVDLGGATLRKLGLVVLGGMLVASVVAVAQGESTGWLWGGVALLGIAGTLYARRFTATVGALRLYSIVFSISLFCVVVVFAALAVTSGQEHRGAFTGLAILWFVMAGAAGALVLGLERRLRRRPRASPDQPTPPPGDVGGGTRGG
jgi:hypothetical protein